MQNLTEEQLEDKANQIRKSVLTALFHAGSGHSGGSLGMADIFTTFYFRLLHTRPREPWWEDRDRLILSNGHICPVWYATLAEIGYFAKDKLNSLRDIQSPFQGHPHYHSLPGVENTSGSLGQGISVAVGVALAAKMRKQNHKVVCISSDGEQQEGQTWEAYLLAQKYKLDNLILIIDRNGIQISGNTEQVLPLEPLRAKLEAFGIFTFMVDGHDISAITDTYYKAITVKNQPIAIIANTIAGKGVSFMENDYRWHGKAPNEQELKKALAELD